MWMDCAADLRLEGCRAKDRSADIEKQDAAESERSKKMLLEWRDVGFSYSIVSNMSGAQVAPLEFARQYLLGLFTKRFLIG